MELPPLYRLRMIKIYFSPFRVSRNTSWYKLKRTSLILNHSADTPSYSPQMPTMKSLNWYQFNQTEPTRQQEKNNFTWRLPSEKRSKKIARDYWSLSKNWHYMKKRPKQ